MTSGALEKLSTFPVFFKVAGQKIVVAGNGDAALAKLRLLGQTNAKLVVIAEKPFPPLRRFLTLAQEKNTGVVWVEQNFTKDLLHDAILVFTAFANEAQNQQVIEAARAQNIPINVVDQPDLCDFYTPTLVNRAPVSVAIGSEGTAPVLTQLIRSKIEAILPQKLGRLARFAAIWRDEIEKLLPQGLARRWFWRRFFSSSIADAVERNTLHDARREVLHLITAAQVQHMGKIIFVDTATTPLKQLQEILLLADHIIYDKSVTAFLLSQGRRDAYRHAGGEHAAKNVELILSLQQEKQMVVRLSHHESLVDQEIALLDHHNLTYERVPFARLHKQKYSPIAA